MESKQRNNKIRIEMILFIKQILKEQFNDNININTEKIAAYLDDNYMNKYFFFKLV